MSSNRPSAAVHTERVCPCLGGKTFMMAVAQDAFLSSYAAILLADKLSLPPVRLTSAFQVGEGERSFHWRIDFSGDLSRRLLFQLRRVCLLHIQWQTGPVNVGIISGAAVTQSLPPTTRQRQSTTIIITLPFCRWLLFGRSYYVGFFFFFVFRWGPLSSAELIIVPCESPAYRASLHLNPLWSALRPPLHSEEINWSCATFTYFIL